MTDLAAALLAEMGAALNERLDQMRAVDFANAVTRKGISAQDIIDIIRRHTAAREDAGDDDVLGTLAGDWMQ
jgi:hypothetical protein